MPIINRENIIYLLIKQTGYIGNVKAEKISTAEKELAETICSLFEIAKDDIEYDDFLALQDDLLFRECVQPELDDPTECKPESSQISKLKTLSEQNSAGSSDFSPTGTPEKKRGRIADGELEKALSYYCSSKSGSSSFNSKLDFDRR